MVQIIDENPGGFLNAIGGGISRGLGASAQSLPEVLKMKKEQEKQDFLNKLIGKGGTQQQSPSQQLVGGAGQQEQPGQGEFNAQNLTDQDLLALSMVDPQTAKLLQHAKDVNLREARANKEMSPDYQRNKEVIAGQTKNDLKYSEGLQEAKKSTFLKSNALDNLEKLNKKGVTGKAYERFLEKIGLVGQTSEGRREFAAEVKNLITDIRSILGSQFSTFEFQTILNAYPSPDFSPEANEAIIKNLKAFQDIRNQEFTIANNLKKENGGKLPEDYQAKVNERLDNFVQDKLFNIKQNTEKIMREKYNVPLGHTLLIDPTNGDMLSVPDNEVDMLLEQGAYHP